MRVSHERLVVDILREQVEDIASPKGIYGQSVANRLRIPEWGLSLAQGFQFGDLRYELPDKTIVIETESAGGLTNLVKYWPYLRRKPDKFFALVHLFEIHSPNDYIAHQRLWAFIVDRMREDLDALGVKWSLDWVAFLRCYIDENDLRKVGEFIRGMLHSTGPQVSPGM